MHFLDENCFTSLWAQLNKIEDINDRVEYILEFSKPYLKQRNIIAEQLANFKDANLNTIKSVASAQNQTERNIQLNHKKHLGYTAKEISRYQKEAFLTDVLINSQLTLKSLIQ